MATNTTVVTREYIANNVAYMYKEAKELEGKWKKSFGLMTSKILNGIWDGGNRIDYNGVWIKSIYIPYILHGARMFVGEEWIGKNRLGNPHMPFEVLFQDLPGCTKKSRGIPQNT